MKRYKSGRFVRLYLSLEDYRALPKRLLRVARITRVGLGFDCTVILPRTPLTVGMIPLHFPGSLMDMSIVYKNEKYVRGN